MKGVITKNRLHYYIDHKELNYDRDALIRFGDRLKDRKPGVPVLSVKEAQSALSSFLNDVNRGIKVTLGGKNIGNFDMQFLKVLLPDIEGLVKHRFVDIGNKYEDADDDFLPDLQTCINRARACNVPGIYIQEDVTHTALEDALQCAELYLGWYNNYLGSPLTPRWRND